MLNGGRSAARGPKANLLRNALLAHHDESRFSVVDIPDLCSDDLSCVLEGECSVMLIGKHLTLRL